MPMILSWGEVFFLLTKIFSSTHKTNVDRNSSFVDMTMIVGKKISLLTFVSWTKISFLRTSLIGVAVMSM